VELAADRFEGAGATVLEAEAQLEDAALAAREPLEHALHLLLEQLVARGIRRRERLRIGDEVPEVAVLFLADGRLERDRLLRLLEDLADLVRRDQHPLSDLFGGRLAAQLLEEPAIDPYQLVDRLHPVDRAASRPRL